MEAFVTLLLKAFPEKSSVSKVPMKRKRSARSSELDLASDAFRWQAADDPITFLANYLPKVITAEVERARVDEDRSLRRLPPRKHRRAPKLGSPEAERAAEAEADARVLAAKELRARAAEAPDPDAGTARRWEGSELERRGRQARCSPRDQRLLRDLWAGKSYAQVAAELGLPVETVKRLARRAVGKIRQLEK